MATVTTSPDEPLVRSGVSWAEYVAFCDSLGERRVRVTYDRGEMEFMTVSQLHERFKHLIALLLSVLCEEMKIDMDGYGNITIRREDLDRGLEPDECYWIEHEPLVRGRTDLDFRHDPPPDLVIEVEITRSALNRMGIYAALGVPEVWRYDEDTIHVCLLQPDGQYLESAQSRSFPFFPVLEFRRFAALSPTMGDIQMMSTFRAWVREQIAAGWKANG